MGLPSHYKLDAIRCMDGSRSPFHKAELELVIYYQNLLDESQRGGDEDMDAFVAWADALGKKIREEWPPQKLAMTYLERGKRRTTRPRKQIQRTRR